METKTRTQYGIYITYKDINGEHQVELLEGPMNKTTATRKARELQQEELRETGYPGHGPIPVAFRTYWAMNMKSGKIAYGLTSY